MRPVVKVSPGTGLRHSPFHLVASLRAATTLERRYGFQSLLAAVADCNLTIICDVIECSSNCTDFLAQLDGVPLIQVLPNLLEPLQQHVLKLAGVDPDNPPASGETMSFKDYFSRLYRIGTGWLGWSPDTTWNATAKEITEAYEGHIEMLRAIYGTKDDDETRTATSTRPENAHFDRGGFERLRAMARV